MRIILNSCAASRGRDPGRLYRNRRTEPEQENIGVSGAGRTHRFSSSSPDRLFTSFRAALDPAFMLLLYSFWPTTSRL